MEFNSNKDLNCSICDGIFANMFATLTGGVFLTGFAIQLGMDEFMLSRESGLCTPDFSPN
jgi:hypothetical protein